jgi:hypothetical protein
MGKKKSNPRGHIISEDGKIESIPDDCNTITDISMWVKEKFGKNINVHISEMEVYFPEINKSIKFLETDKGFLISTKKLTIEEFEKISKNHPWVSGCFPEYTI